MDAKQLRQEREESNMGKGSEQRKLHRSDEKFCENYDSAFTKKLHKETEATTVNKRQVSAKDLPVGMRSRTIYGS
jgi:stalled ribosome alternative rescue factor ArfA